LVNKCDQCTKIRDIKFYFSYFSK